MNINIEKFAEKFKENYKFLYEHYDNVAGFKEAVDFFDNYIHTINEKNLVREFADYRKDVISSDREAAAFSFTMEDFGMLD